MRKHHVKDTKPRSMKRRDLFKQLGAAAALQPLSGCASDPDDEPAGVEPESESPQPEHTQAQEAVPSMTPSAATSPPQVRPTQPAQQPAQPAAQAPATATATQPTTTAPQPKQEIAVPATMGADTTRFFPGFTNDQVNVTGATINLAKGGAGPALLLLHGAPYSHVTWRLIAPELAKKYTVIATDLRGYGDSSKSADTPDHANYSKRNMANDQVEVMKHYGFDKFAVVGHDRGGRVAQRMALDHADKVTKIAVIDIVPTYYSYTHVTLAFVQAYYHWFNYLRAAPVPENELMMQNRGALGAGSEVQKEYQRTSSTMENIHAMCEDYRAAASIDLEHDAADIATKITAPLLTLWASNGSIGKIFDVLAVWKERAVTVTGKELAGGHSLQEDASAAVLAELTPFLES